MHNLSHNIGKWIIFIFSENFFSLVKFRIVVFCITEHANLSIFSADKFTNLGHFANSAVCCRLLRFSPSNFAFMIRKMPLFLLSIIRTISLIVLKEFRLFCDFKIFDVVKVLFWRNIGSCHLSSRNVNKVTLFARSNAIGCIMLIGGRGGRRIIAYICLVSVQ